jgi:hypothetical protein
MISFSLPWALVGLLAAGLPLLLHLVRRHDAPEVTFPAVRYLADASRNQLKRLRFRHLLLLLLRTLLVITLVLAAAGATIRRRLAGPHAPASLVLVIDNSAASAVVLDGEPLLHSLVTAAERVIDHATRSDRLWLLPADGVVRSGSPAELRADLAHLMSEPVRLDLGQAVALGRKLIGGSGRTGEVVVVGPMQRSALTGAGGEGNLLVLRPAATMPVDRAVGGIATGAQPWSPAGGRVTIAVTAPDTTPVPLTLSLDGRPLREVLVTPGVPSVQRVGPTAPGWHVVTAALPPDEFRLDDAASEPIRVADPVSVHWDSADRYLAAAAQVLASDGRIRAGSGIQLGTLGSGISVVLPPEDPARTGALNRALAARGVPWRFGALVVTPGTTDSGVVLPAKEPVSRRYLLEQSGSGGEVLATVDGTPWLVRSGDVLLLGSRLDPAWTALPLTAPFVPFLDAVLTGAAAHRLPLATVNAGEPVTLPPAATAVSRNGMMVAAGGRWVPRTLGVFHLLAGPDTLGAVAVRVDPRATDLARAGDTEIRALWRGATVAGLQDGPDEAFAAGTRTDLRGILLVVALCCALVETLIVSRFRPQ